MPAWPETHAAANKIAADNVSPRLGRIEEWPKNTEAGLKIQLWKISTPQCR